MEDERKLKYEENAVREEARMKEKSRFQNLQRYLHRHRQEFEVDQKISDSKDQEALRHRQFEQEENLARELDKIKRGEIVDKKLRQQLRETSHELKELEKKLQLAYVQKELAAQIAEKQAQRMYEKVKVKQEQEMLNKARIDEKEYSKRLAEENLRKSLEYRHELQDQIIYQEKKKRFEYEEFLREKKMIDDIVERIYVEDEREITEKMCKIQKTKEEMMAFKQAQETWRQKKREEIEEENRRIHEYLMSKATSAQSRALEKAKLEASKNAVIEKIVQDIYLDKTQKQKREEIMQELLLEEIQETNDQMHRAKIEKDFKTKIEVRKSLIKQMNEKVERSKRDAELDAEFKERMLAKQIEDQRLDQLSNQKRRMKMIQIRKDVEQMMFDKRQKRAEQLQIQKLLREQDEISDEARRKIIEEERMNMLQEHCKKLVGFLPKGILRPEDLTVLGTDILGK